MHTWNSIEQEATVKDRRRRSVCGPVRHISLSVLHKHSLKISSSTAVQSYYPAHIDARLDLTGLIRTLLTEKQ
jgi:hypothetical protein